MFALSIIILTLTIEYFYDDIKKFRDNSIIINIFTLYQDKFSNFSFIKKNTHLAFLILFLLISMIIMTFINSISSVIFFLVSILIVLYCLRTNQYNRDIEELKIKLEFNKNEIDKSLLFKLCPNLKQTRIKSNLNNLIIQNLFFNSIANTFSILFYFLLIGPAAILTYTVLNTMIYSDKFKITAKVRQELKRYMYFIDYIPVRLTSYTFSVISNYDNVIERINNLKLSNNNYLSNIEFINQVGDSVYDSELKESEQIIQIQNILARTLIAWVSAITLLSIAGILV
jgi:membrane protein required for beta-lactamase induction